LKIPKILFASSNSGKVNEARQIAAGYNLDLISINQLECSLGQAPQVEENAVSFKGNALLKAEQYSAWSKQPTIADDSGLEISVLGGEPGIYSARYAGKDLPFEKNIELVLEKLYGIEDRAARFVCHIIMHDGSAGYQHFVGVMEGEISHSPAGSGGFGYDCIFRPRGYTETLAALKARGEPVKTHRVLALEECFSHFS